MALKIVARPVFMATVAVNTQHVQGDLQVTYTGYSTSALEAIEKQAAAEGKNPQDAVLLAVVTGFELVDLPDDTTLRYTGPEAVLRLCDWPGIGPALLRGYYRAVWEERRGNFERLPDGSTSPAQAQPTTTPTPDSP